MDKNIQKTFHNRAVKLSFPKRKTFVQYESHSGLKIFYGKCFKSFPHLVITSWNTRRLSMENTAAVFWIWNFSKLLRKRSFYYPRETTDEKWSNREHIFLLCKWHRSYQHRNIRSATESSCAIYRYTIQSAGISFFSSISSILWHCSGILHP